MTRPRLAALLLAGLAAAAPAQGADWLVALDPAATEIRFTLDATLHTVRGTVALESGEIRLDTASGALAGRLVVDAASAETGNESRDGKMHETVLESGRFGRIILEPERLEGELALDGTSRVVVHGTLELHGDRHQVALPAQVTVEAANRQLRAAATLEVPYVAWGMKDPSKLLLRVGKLVRVEIDAVATLVPASASSP